MTRRFPWLLAVMLVVAGCGGGGNGDLEAYCQQVRQGKGLVAADEEIDAGELEDLLEVAPPEIKPSVAKLANTARDLDEIEELDELFAAAFDPDAQAARTAFDTFAVDSCGLEPSMVSTGEVALEDDLLGDIGAYVDTNFRDETWATKVRYDLRVIDGEVENLSINFVVGAEDDEALDACRALSVWLYSVQGSDGTVRVTDDDLVVVERDSPDANCDSTS